MSGKPELAGQTVVVIGGSSGIGLEIARLDRGEGGHGDDRTITLEGDANGAPHPEPSAYAKKFSGKYAHRTITGGIGHHLPQEAPQAFAQPVIDVDRF